MSGSRRHIRAGPLTLILIALAILLSVLPLASQFLTDSLWIAGLYDGADYDDVIALSTDCSPSILPPNVVGPPCLVVRARVRADTPHLGRVFYPAVPPRSPPTV